MIKVNLLRNRAEGNRAPQGTSVTQVDGLTSIEAPTEPMDSSQLKQFAIKFVLILSITGGMMLYESFNIDNLRDQLTNLNKINTDLQAEITKNQPVATKAKELQKKISDLESRIKIIKDLSRTRLREIKALDYIQNVIPEKVWLSSLEFADDKVKIIGDSMADDQLNKFLEQLDGKSYFQNVILLKAVETKSKDGTIKNFEIASSLKATD
jgi:Tfp pilus assembly protein PilN